MGTRLTYRIEHTGRPTTEERWEVVAADERGCTIASQLVDPATGDRIADQGAATTEWSAFAARSAFLSRLTTITDATSTVPAGTFATRRYTVGEPNGVVRIYDFAPDLPGPPVRIVTTRDGEVRETLVLAEVSAAAAADPGE